MTDTVQGVVDLTGAVARLEALSNRLGRRVTLEMEIGVSKRGSFAEWRAWEDRGRHAAKSRDANV